MGSKKFNFRTQWMAEDAARNAHPQKGGVRIPKPGVRARNVVISIGANVATGGVGVIAFAGPLAVAGARELWKRYRIHKGLKAAEKFASGESADDILRKMRYFVQHKKLGEIQRSFETMMNAKSTVDREVRLSENLNCVGWYNILEKYYSIPHHASQLKATMDDHYSAFYHFLADSLPKWSENVGQWFPDMISAIRDQINSDEERDHESCVWLTTVRDENEIFQVGKTCYRWHLEDTYEGVEKLAVRRPRKKVRDWQAYRAKEYEDIGLYKLLNDVANEPGIFGHKGPANYQDYTGFIDAMMQFRNHETHGEGFKKTIAKKARTTLLKRVAIKGAKGVGEEFQEVIADELPLGGMRNYVDSGAGGGGLSPEMFQGFSSWASITVRVFLDAYLKAKFLYKLNTLSVSNETELFRLFKKSAKENLEKLLKKFILLRKEYKLVKEYHARAQADGYAHCKDAYQAAYHLMMFHKYFLETSRYLADFSRCHDHWESLMGALLDSYFQIGEVITENLEKWLYFRHGQGSCSGWLCWGNNGTGSAIAPLSDMPSSQNYTLN